jgi:SAM-dependent methyltransferase
MPPWRRFIASIRRKVRNATFDIRYGGYLGGWRPSTHPGATAVVHTDYRLMPQIFSGRFGPADVLVDVGCGYGRVINWWLDHGHTGPIFGLEQEAEVAAHLRRRLRKFTNVTILTGDAVLLIPPNADVVFLFNPFEWPDTLRRLLDRLYELAKQRSNLRILYYAPVLLNVIVEDGRWAVEEVDLSLPEDKSFEDRHRRLAVITPRGSHARSVADDGVD